MAGVTAKDLMAEQHRRFMKQKQKEEESRITEDAKSIFRRPPYPGFLTRQYNMPIMREEDNDEPGKYKEHE